MVLIIVEGLEIRFSVRFLVSASVMAGLASFWFSGSSKTMNSKVITNDLMNWPIPERLVSESDYRDWYRSIPDGTAWTRADDKVTIPIDFSRFDLVIAPLKKSSAPYQSSSTRCCGGLTVVYGEKFESGPAAQELIIPKNSILLYGSRSFLWFLDVGFLLVFLGGPLTYFSLIWKRSDRTPKR